MEPPQDIHAGFRTVDQTTAPDDLVRFLDAVDTEPFVQDIKRLMTQQLHIGLGQRVLDVGCGVGHEVQRIAALVGVQGQAVGLDASAYLLNKATDRATQAGVSAAWQHADAHTLPFPNAAFDGCRSERVLMYVDDPQQVINEMARVLRPGGYLCCFDWDYGGVIIDGADRQLTAQIIEAVIESVPNSWMGRQLSGMLYTSGCIDIQVISYLVRVPAHLPRRVFGRTLEQAQVRGQLDAAALNAWWHDQDARQAAGVGLLAIPGFVVSGRKP